MENDRRAGPKLRRSLVPFASVLAFAGLVAALTMQVSSRAADAPVIVPPPAAEAAEPAGMQTAVLAGGCFWGVQAVFQHVRGVSQVLSGYAGGARETARYDIVSRGQSRHAEAVRIRFDPKEVSYGRILQIFFSVAHDPTQLNRQGPDTGSQYRSAIFPADDNQKAAAERYIAQLGATGLFKQPIVTTLEPLSAFYPAEDYHQDYYHLHPRQLYIVVHDKPKVENLKKVFPDLYSPEPMTVARSGT